MNVSPGYISTEVEDYYLVVGHLVDYKRIDLAIEVCNRLQRPLRIIGTGEQYKRLRGLAGPTVKFLGFLRDEELHEYYARCRALLFPGEEDIGLTPIEAQASGRPVIAYGRGGALKTVIALSPDEGYPPKGRPGFSLESSPWNHSLRRSRPSKKRSHNSLLRSFVPRWNALMCRVSSWKWAPI